jgi:glutathione S-transferase
MAANNTITFYDLTMAHGATTSPFVWATKYALAHKGFTIDTVPGGFTGIMERTGGMTERLPAIVDDGKWVLDSWGIVEYLDATYPDRPMLIPHESVAALTKALDAWWWPTAVGPWMRCFCADYRDLCFEHDKDYVTTSREKMLGMQAGGHAGRPRRTAAADLRRDRALAHGPARAPVAGRFEPNYADYRILGPILFLASVGKVPSLAEDDPLRDWIERCRDLYGGLGRHPGPDEPLWPPRARRRAGTLYARKLARRDLQAQHRPRLDPRRNRTHHHQGLIALRILITRRWPVEVERAMAAQFDVVLNEGDKPLSQADLASAMGEFDVLCPTVSDRIDADVIAGGDRVKLIANYGVGFDHIDLAAAKAKGISVTNTPGVLTDATADIAMTLLLMAARRAGEGERELRAGQWSGWRPTHLVGSALKGKVLGCVGFGRIAQATARRAHHGFGMKVAYYARRPADDAVAQELQAEFVPYLKDLLGKADFVSLHVPGGAETANMIDAPPSQR